MLAQVHVPFVCTRERLMDPKQSVNSFLRWLSSSSRYVVGIKFVYDTVEVAVGRQRTMAYLTPIYRAFITGRSLLGVGLKPLYLTQCVE